MTPLRRMRQRAAARRALKSLLDHFSTIEDPREPWRVAHPLPEVLLLVVCGTMADCDDYEAIAAWGKINLAFLRRYLPYAHGVPGGRWLTLLINRINPALFSAVFSAWVRKAWPDRPHLIAIDGKSSRRSHDRAQDKGPRRPLGLPYRSRSENFSRARAGSITPNSAAAIAKAAAPNNPRRRSLNSPIPSMGRLPFGFALRLSEAR
jgi:hypothetical protein